MMSEDSIIKENADIKYIKNRIYEVRGLRVMLDRDLAELYGVETKGLNHAVRRNIERFPVDFMFKLNKSEWVFLRSQIANSSWGGTRKKPSTPRKRIGFKTEKQ